MEDGHKQQKGKEESEGENFPKGNCDLGKSNLQKGKADPDLIDLAEISARSEGSGRVISYSW